MQTRMAVAAHHQKIDIELATFFDQRVGNLVLLADGAVFEGVDAVMPEVMHGVIAHQRLRFRRMRPFNDENADLPCLVQIGEGLCKRTRRLPAAIPRHDDVFEWRNRLWVVWERKTEATRATQ